MKSFRIFHIVLFSYAAVLVMIGIACNVSYVTHVSAIEAVVGKSITEDHKIQISRLCRLQANSLFTMFVVAGSTLALATAVEIVSLRSSQNNKY